MNILITLNWIYSDEAAQEEGAQLSSATAQEEGAQLSRASRAALFASFYPNANAIANTDTDDDADADADATGNDDDDDDDDDDDGDDELELVSGLGALIIDRLYSSNDADILFLLGKK